MKKKLPPKSKQVFPSNTRFITDFWKSLEKHIGWRLLVVGVSILLFLGMLLTGYEYLGARKDIQKAKAQRASIEKKVVFWKNQTQLHPDFRDAYFQIALLEYQLGDKSASSEYIKKTTEVDPNFRKGEELRKLLE